nr:septal ring lytic transglycosylase RlpA family protein [Acuticoccus kalidii]
MGLAGCGGSVSSIETALATDGGDTKNVEGRKMIGKPYKVGGRWYHPEVDEDYNEVGMASWYGPKFHGKSTANGERFDQNALTAAHPTLPIPSYVRITVAKTGKSTVVRVNDRGPFHGNRIIDVSKAAAVKLGFRLNGSAKVRVEYLGPAPVGGSDKETLAAEAEFNKTQPGKQPSRGFFGFGGNKDKDAKDIEVRLAAATDAPMTPSRESSGRIARNGSLPGVHLPDPPMRPNADAMTPASASAYQESSDGPMDALETMNAEAALAAMEAEKAPPVAVQPLPETAEEESQGRVMGAHDMFASLGMAPMAESAETPETASAAPEAPAADDETAAAQ